MFWNLRSFAAVAVFGRSVALLRPWRSNIRPRTSTSSVVLRPGSGADVIVRFIGEKMKALSGRSIIVENKPGAGGNIATEYVARAKPDGYTVYITGASALAANMHVIKNPSVDVGKALQIVGTINKQPVMIAVRRNSPYKTMAELTQAMKAKGDKASYALRQPDGESGRRHVQGKGRAAGG